MSDLPDSVTIPILLNNLRLMARKNDANDLPITADLMFEAADVIERVTADRARLSKWLDDCNAVDVPGELVQARLEVERLEAEVTDLRSRCEAAESMYSEAVSGTVSRVWLGGVAQDDD